ncbi:hypothetical protein NIES2104_53990 [Leptolyngbya sp. NIES-2104]|nr:hypothetical protein NIES2104_53990 [Leptolyngbya sp. NIES-2104]
MSAGGLERVLELLDRLNIKATFFVTADFAIHHPSTMRNLRIFGGINCRDISKRDREKECSIA